MPGVRRSHVSSALSLPALVPVAAATWLCRRGSPRSSRPRSAYRRCDFSGTNPAFVRDLPMSRRQPILLSIERAAPQLAARGLGDDTARGVHLEQSEVED